MSTTPDFRSDAEIEEESLASPPLEHSAGRIADALESHIGALDSIASQLVDIRICLFVLVILFGALVYKLW